MNGNGSTVSITHFGEGNLVTSVRNLKLSDMFHVSQLVKNLISVNRLCADNNVVEFLPNSFNVRDVSQDQTLQATYVPYIAKPVTFLYPLCK